MNLVEVSTWIQEGYKEYYHMKKDLIGEERMNKSVEEYVMYYVLKKGRGHLNPNIITDMISWENSIPDENGWRLC